MLSAVCRPTNLVRVGVRVRVGAGVRVGARVRVRAHEPTKLQRVRFSREHRRRSRARAAAVDARALAELCRP